MRNLPWVTEIWSRESSIWRSQSAPGVRRDWSNQTSWLRRSRADFRRRARGCGRRVRSSGRGAWGLLFEHERIYAASAVAGNDAMVVGERAGMRWGLALECGDWKAGCQVPHLQRAQRAAGLQIPHL